MGVGPNSAAATPPDLYLGDPKSDSPVLALLGLLRPLGLLPPFLGEAAMRSARLTTTARLQFTQQQQLVGQYAGHAQQAQQSCASSCLHHSTLDKGTMKASHALDLKQQVAYPDGDAIITRLEGLSSSIRRKKPDALVLLLQLLLEDCCC